LAAGKLLRNNVLKGLDDADPDVPILKQTKAEYARANFGFRQWAGLDLMGPIYRKTGIEISVS
jgi:hypothetical protein